MQGVKFQQTKKKDKTILKLELPSKETFRVDLVRIKKGKVSHLYWHIDRKSKHQKRVCMSAAPLALKIFRDPPPLNPRHM